MNSSEPTVLKQSDVERAVLNYLQENHNVPFNKCVEDVAALKSFDKELVTRTIDDLIKRGIVTRKRRAGLNLASLDSSKQELGEEKIRNLSAKAIKLWNLIPQDGSFVTNLGLRYSLRPMSFSTEEFWSYRKELLGKGLITIRRGRGGSVARAPEIVETQETELPPTLVKDETELYDKMRDWLQKNRVAEDENSGGQAWSVVTGKPKKWKRGAGHWSRPDVTLVEVMSYEILRHKDVAVTTYEIKKYNPQMDNSWVFEAASHSKGAHYSYLVVETSKDKFTDEPPAELSADLRQFGIGFGWLYLNTDANTDAKEYEFHEILEADRKDPDPEYEEELLENFVSKLTLGEQTAFKAAM
jgi:predicted transcriptional regulator